MALKSGYQKTIFKYMSGNCPFSQEMSVRYLSSYLWVRILNSNTCFLIFNFTDLHDLIFENTPTVMFLNTYSLCLCSNVFFFGKCDFGSWGYVTHYCLRMDIFCFLLLMKNYLVICLRSVKTRYILFFENRTFKYLVVHFKFPFMFKYQLHNLKILDDSENFFTITFSFTVFSVFCLYLSILY
uniref:Ovule protein n=1 Tax=Heterorhabditis bacteriophora TaxID=37862 RepID=A0A1I7WZ54_HETBA